MPSQRKYVSGAQWQLNINGLAKCRLLSNNQYSKESWQYQRRKQCQSMSAKMKMAKEAVSQ